MAILHPILVEFDGPVDRNMLTKRGIAISGQSDLMPILYADATAAQILDLATETGIKVVSLDAKVSVPAMGSGTAKV